MAHFVDYQAVPGLPGFRGQPGNPVLNGQSPGSLDKSIDPLA
jgi:hypothetical protein